MDNSEGVSHEDCIELLSCVTNGEHRADILSNLEGSKLSIRRLSDQIKIPRTTLRHNLEQLQEHGLVQETVNRDYRLTQLGQATMAGIQDFHDRVNIEVKLQPHLSGIPSDKIGFDIKKLSDADIVSPTSYRPFLPLNKLIDNISNANEIIALLPSIPFVFEEKILEFAGGCNRIELMLPAKQYRSGSDEGQPGLSESLRSSLVTVTVIDETVEYGIVLSDDCLYLLSVDDNMKPHSLIITDQQYCVRWARSFLESYRERSERISKPNP